MKFTPLRITVIYLAFAYFWITTTDPLIVWLFDSVNLITQVQMLKGYLYVSATALFLYWMVKNFECTLKREQELQSKILSTIPVMITVYRPNLSDFSVNLEFEKTIGWSSKDLRYIDLFDEIYPDKEYQKEVRKFMKNPDGCWKDFEIVTRNGKKIQTTWTNIQLSDETQIGIGIDITTRKDIEEKFKKNEEWLQLTTTSSNIGLWEWYPHSGKIQYDKIWASIIGYDLDELQPIDTETWTQLIHPDDLNKFEKEIDRYFSGEKPIYECEVRLRHKQGHWVWILDRGRIVEWDDLGKPVRLVGTHVDITHQKNIEQRIEAERRRFEIAASLTSDVIWEWYPENDELWWSDGIESVFGYSKEEYEGVRKFWQNHIAEHDRERVIKSMEETERSTATEWSEEYDFIASDGSLKKVRDSAVLLRNEEGSILRIIGAMVDRTQEIEYREALFHQSYRFEMIAKSSNDVLYEWNLETDDVWWSEGWQTRFHYSDSDIRSDIDWWSQKVHPDDHDTVLKSLKTAVCSNKGYWVAYYRLKNGKNTYSNVVNRGYFLKDERGNNKYMVGTISDVTADLQAQAELKASEEQYRLLFEQNPIPMWIFDPDTYEFSTVNKAALDKYGYSKEEMLNLTILDIRPQSEIEQAKQAVKKQLKKKHTAFMETTHLAKGGKKLIVEVSSSAIFYKGKKQRLVIAHDITDQRKAEERAISAIIEGEERERQRIAKELHDGLGQYLSASNMNLKSVYEDLDVIPEALQSAFETGLNFLDHAISETVSISQNLMPKAIQDYGLELAAESLINHLRNSHKIDFYLYTNLDNVTLSEKVQINLYRILQEALNNAIRHGKPSKIDVQLVYSKEEILMTIEDNGKGFDKNQITENGIGIRSIKTRVGAMSANLDIVSNLNRGTIISVVVPVNQN